MKQLKTASLLLLSTFILVNTGCKKKGCTDNLANNFEEKAKTDNGSCAYDNTNLNIELTHSVDDATLEFDTINYISALGNKYSVEKLLYFISDVTIFNENGDSVYVDDEFYIDAKDNSTLSITTNESLPVGTYTGIKFTFGLDANKNKSGRFPNAPESNMEWPETMGGGYHFMKLEGKYDSLAAGTSIKNYQTHTGSQTMMNMSNLNHFYIELNKSFEVQGHASATLKLDMNVNNWYDEPLYDFNNYDNGVMMSMTTQDTIQANGTNVFSLEVEIQD